MPQICGPSTDRLLSRRQHSVFAGALTTVSLALVNQTIENEASLPSFIDGPDTWLAGYTHLSRAHPRESQGDLDQARQDVAAALDRFTQVGDLGVESAGVGRAVAGTRHGTLSMSASNSRRSTGRPHMKVRRSAFPRALSAPAEVVADRYRLGARLGSGGAADVYQGMDIRLERPVAVKVFRPGSEPALEQRFADEAVLLAGLQHPGLVTVYDAGRHQDRPFLVMELVQGPTLAKRISAGAMKPPHVVRLGTALAGALAHVHAAGIVHRDVKPSNVLLDTADVPHLADFGISRMMGATRHTASGALLGTAAYLAPEQVLGKAVGPSADIYALGLVLLECMKGELEYDGTPLEAAVARLHRPPTIPCSVPPRLAELLHAMTALEDTARPDAGQCAETLSALSSEVLVPTAANAADSGMDTHAQQATKPLRTRRPLLATGAAVLTALLGATLVVSADGEGNSNDRSAAGSPGSPLQQPSHTTSPESPRTAAGQPTVSPTPPLTAHHSATSAASDPQARTRSADPTSSPNPGTSADREDAQHSRSRLGAAQTDDKNPPEKSAKSKGPTAEKERR